MINYNIERTKKFIKNNENIFFTKADKGNVTVAIDRNVYNNKVEDALNDDKYYMKLKNNPINGLKNKIIKMIDCWENRGVFECDVAFKHVNNKLDNTLVPRAYALIKIHKVNNPIRIIVSAINSPTYRLDKSICLLLNRHVPKPQSSLKNSIELKNILDNTLITSEYSLVSFDVVSLFSNIPKHLILEALADKWKYLKSFLCISKSEFLQGIDVLLDSTYLQFNGKFYKQILGAPMGFCTSSWFADIVLEKLENNCLNVLNNNILRYFRYVDDCFLIIKKDKILDAIDTFNNYNNQLQFTYEVESDNCINFLDISITRRPDDFPLTNWYRKNTASGRYINFHSHHPFSQKVAIVYTLVDKAILLSDKSFHNQNISIIKTFLIANDFPIHIINKYINKRLAHIHNKQTNNNSQNKTQRSFSNYNTITFPYNKYINPKIKGILHKHNIALINKTTDKFNKYIKLGKDIVDKDDINIAVYKIDCNDCDATYIGMTTRALKHRKKEHARCIKNKDERSPLAIHHINTGHNFNIENTQIIDKVNNNYTLKF